MKQYPHEPLAGPLFLGPRNAESQTGLTWRYLRKVAEDLGVETIAMGASKVVLPAAPLLAALQRKAEAEAGPSLASIRAEMTKPLEGSVDEMAAMRARVGRS